MKSNHPVRRAIGRSVRTIGRFTFAMALGAGVMLGIAGLSQLANVSESLEGSIRTGSLATVAVVLGCVALIGYGVAVLAELLRNGKEG
jgi:hypothetical protein